VLLLMALANLDVEIGPLLTGLGVGGIAVALAVQNILGDLFASLSIVLDKPFVIGDFIIVGDLMGTVEYVGLKTTRVRSLSGEQLVFANSDLLNARIRNFKRMHERRVVFTVGVTYQTPRAQLAEIPTMIREIVEGQEKARFDRAHFKGYGAFSIDFETVFYVLDPDYNLYMDVQQAINLALHERFEEHGIEFAYPTQTLFVEKVEGLQPAAAG
jgi:small-conductance mechanosensitive channel